jgi:hypothetical protein
MGVECIEQLSTMFSDNDWDVYALPKSVKYIRRGYELDLFEIVMTSTKTIAVVPLKNSEFVYKTTFLSCQEACDYIEKRYLELY